MYLKRASVIALGNAAVLARVQISRYRGVAL
jgi:hypothetical protein